MVHYLEIFTLVNISLSNVLCDNRILYAPKIIFNFLLNPKLKINGHIQMRENILNVKKNMMHSNIHIV